MLEVRMSMYNFCSLKDLRNGYFNDKQRNASCHHLTNISRHKYATRGYDAEPHFLNTDTQVCLIIE